jgi:dolichyl-phosphate beta-glucosyltransferase
MRHGSSRHGSRMTDPVSAFPSSAAPTISIVVPTLNEEGCIESCLARVTRYLSQQPLSWEILVVDDGSTDRTGALVQAWAGGDARVRLLRQSHGGKGAAVRHGMLASKGAWRFMADADLSVAPEDWSRLLDAALAPAGADVILASREAVGARRIDEPPLRHLLGRIFNWMVQLFAVPGIDDTQCGFKLFSDAAANAVFPRVTIKGFAFDVEALFLVRRAGFAIREVGVTWMCRTDSRVGLVRGGMAFADILRIRWRHLRGRYDGVHRPGHDAGRVSKRGVQDPRAVG